MATASSPATDVAVANEPITIFVRPCAQAPKLRIDKLKLDKKITVIANSRFYSML